MQTLVIKRYTLLSALLFVEITSASAQVAEIIQVSSVVNERETLLNPGKFSTIPSPTHETALILSDQLSVGDLTSFSYRMRLEYDSGEPEQRFDATLQEASFSTFIQQRWVVNAGKTQLGWDMATSFQPLGFFQDSENLFDLTDVQSRSSGLPLIAATYLRPSWSATVVYSDDKWSAYDGFNSGVEQWGGRFQYQSASSDWSLVLQKPAGQNMGAGFSATFSPTDYMVTYVSAFYRQGTRRPQNLMLDSRQPQLAAFYPFSHHRKQSDTPYWRGVLGSTFAFRHLDLTLELTHDERGLDTLMWRRLSDLIAFHNQLLISETTPEVRELIARNLFFDSQTLSTHGARETYVFAYLKTETDYADASLYTRTALEDKSALVGITLQKTLSTALTISLSAQTFLGGQHDEFGITPVDSSFQFTLRYLFN
ncbi:hypothetical protein [Lacimicrobium alkaliphilum]|uniref:TIGR03016 family PEP-CTERM system-associated outer membrane protein n=1 Tax=Lacimicrobium alkaliphilum TaxID=1526571 RepID=A0ABQ1RP91_9ALTE|nr:hypothetical protein [Lacimicrobium alkaliphilum]GGD73255.1 hypothetical protein GCM10011357_30410 [Lacimicrobium alkaliphilum]